MCRTACVLRFDIENLNFFRGTPKKKSVSGGSFIRGKSAKEELKAVSQGLFF